MNKRAKATDAETPPLKGWRQIASFLGEPVSVAQRWANEGMPVRRQGRFVSTTEDEINSWLRREAGKPVDVVTDSTDLTAELKRGLAFVRHKNAPSRAKERPARAEARS